MSLFLVVSVTVLACTAVAIGYSGAVQASQEQTNAQASTPTPDQAGAAGGAAGNAINSAAGSAASQASPPAPESTEAAAASATANASGAGSVPTGGPPPLPSGEAGSVSGTGSGTTTAGSSGEFPWVIVGVVVVLALAGLLFAAMRSRRPAETTAATSSQMRRTSDVRNLTAPPSGTTPAGAAVATAATAAAADAEAQATTAMVTCPNCGTSNASTEKYCHECGQDLRPAIEQMAAAQAATTPLATGAPVDVVDADTPYLETVDRVDEQLEFVLSRQRVVLGTAPTNDIVVDAAFKGWQTVSPQHAELRREQEGFVIVDRDSENGTFVNDMRTGENLLADGDLVRLGDVRFYFRVPKGEG